MCNSKFLWLPLKPELYLSNLVALITVIRDHSVSLSKMLFFGPPLEVAKRDFLNLANVLMSPRFDSNILIFIVNYDSTLINNNLFNNQSNEMKMHLLKVIFNCPYFLTIPIIINVSKMQMVGP